VTPTSKRIVEDIELLPEVLNKIIEARGCVVQVEKFRGLRSGRRAKDSGQLAPKVRRHQRMLDMSSSVPNIEEIKEARKLIQGGATRTGFDASPGPVISVVYFIAFGDTEKFAIALRCASFGAVQKYQFFGHIRPRRSRPSRGS
jgi:hypothetical protein